MGRVYSNLVRFLKAEMGSATAACSALLGLTVIVCVTAAPTLGPNVARPVTGGSLMTAPSGLAAPGLTATPPDARDSAITAPAGMED